MRQTCLNHINVNFGMQTSALRNFLGHEKIYLVKKHSVVKRVITPAQWN